MTTTDKHLEEKEKILKGLEKVYEKLVEFKKAKIENWLFCETTKS